MNLSGYSGKLNDDPFDIRNLSDTEFFRRNLTFDREIETSYQQINRVHREQWNNPVEVPCVRLAQSSFTPCRHILKVGEVALFKSGPQGRLQVLVRTTFTGPDREIEIEFSTGYIFRVPSWLLFWEEHWIENPGDIHERRGSSDIPARIAPNHQFNYIAPFVATDSEGNKF